jgi:hypothetical protein
MCLERSITAATGRPTMDTRYTRAARRELGFVLCVAVFGIAMVLLVAFAPWYESMVLG